MPLIHNLCYSFYELKYSCVHHTHDIDGGATEADGGASAPVSPSVAMPL